MRNEQNLKSYQKGQSGNPNGRPAGSRNVSTVLTEMLRELAPKAIIDASFIKEISKSRKRPTLADAVAAKIIYMGLVNDQPWALKELLDRTEGKPAQSIRTEVEKPAPLEMAIEVSQELIRKYEWDPAKAWHYAAQEYGINPDEIPRSVR